MAAFIAAPLGGAFVSTALIYTFRHHVATRTTSVVETLHASKLRLDSLDEDSPTGQLSPHAVRAAYISPVRPTLSEEIKARWNEHLEAGVGALEKAHWDEIAVNGWNVAKRSWNNLAGMWRDEAPVASAKESTFLGQGASLR